MSQKQRDWKESLGQQLGTPEGEARLAQLDPDQACSLLCELVERQERQASAPLRPTSILAGVLSIVSLFLFLGFTQGLLSTLIGLFLPALFIFSYLVVLICQGGNQSASPGTAQLLALLRERVLEPDHVQSLSLLLFLAERSPLTPMDSIDRPLWKALTLRLSMTTPDEAKQLTSSEVAFLVARLQALRGVEDVEQQAEFVAAALLVVAASHYPHKKALAQLYRNATRSAQVKEAADDIIKQRYE